MKVHIYTRATDSLQLCVKETLAHGQEIITVHNFFIWQFLFFFRFYYYAFKKYVESEFLFSVWCPEVSRSDVMLSSCVLTQIDMFP